MLFTRRPKLVLIAVLFGLLIFITQKFLSGKSFVFDAQSEETGHVFDWTNCAEFGVFLPNYSNKSSKEEQMLAKLTMQGNYWQKEIKKACLLVYFISETQNLLKQNFPDQGMNSVFIFLHGIKPTKEFRRKKFRAIFAATDFEDGAFFPSIDIRLHIALVKPRQKVPTIFHKRKHFVTMQINSVYPTPQYQHYYEQCVDHKKICQLLPLEGKVGATFILMFTNEKENFVKNLHNALASGTIPVFIEDSSKFDLKSLLPMSDLIEWHRAAIFLKHRKMDFQSLILLLQNVPKWKIFELRRMGCFYFQHFFGDAKVLVRAILTAIRHRFRIAAPAEKIVSAKVLFQLLPINGSATAENPAELMNSQFFDEDINRLWNSDPTFLDASPKVQHYWRPPHLQHNTQQQMNAEFYPKFAEKLLGNWKNDEKFTIVIEAYRRDHQLLYTLGSLNGLRYLDRVIVIWGDFARPITEQSYAWPHIHVPIFVINTSRDSLNDRFLPFSLIRTEAVLSIDDDFNVEHGSIEFSFRVWRENRNRIVGPNYRIGYAKHLEHNGLIGVYKGPPRHEPIFQNCQYNIVLTSGAFIHRDFLASYSNEMPSEIRAHVDKITNCEDIAIAMWVSYLTRLGPLKTTQIGNTIGVFTQNATGLSSRPDHFAQRSECIKLFSKILGHNPLVVSEYRADSLLYNQQAVTSKKCFKNE